MKQEKCGMCVNAAEENSKLCKACNMNRLAAASQARIFSGSGLTYQNVDEYSEENWIRANNENKE